MVGPMRSHSVSHTFNFLGPNPFATCPNIDKKLAISENGNLLAQPIITGTWAEPPLTVSRSSCKPKNTPA